MEIDMKVRRGQILKELRKQKSLSQTDLSKIIGVSVQAYQKYEYGTAEPTFDSICKLADFYGVTTDYLLGRKTQVSPIDQVSDIELEKRFLQAYFDLISPQLRSKVWDELEQMLKEQIAKKSVAEQS